MSQSTLEQRVAALEREVAELRTVLANGGQIKDWRSTVGMFSGDEGMKRIDEAGRRWREAERRKARRKSVRTRRTTS